MSYPYGQRRDEWSQGQRPPFPPPKFPPSPAGRAPQPQADPAALLQNVSMLAAQLQPSQQTTNSGQSDAAAKAFQLLQQIQQHQQQGPGRSEHSAQPYATAPSSSSYQAPPQRYSSPSNTSAAAAWGARYATAAPPSAGGGGGGGGRDSSGDRYAQPSSSRYDSGAPRYETGSSRYDAPPARYASDTHAKRYEPTPSYGSGRGSYGPPKRYDDYKGSHGRSRYKSPPRTARREKHPRPEKEKKRGLPTAPKFPSTQIPVSEPPKRKTPLQKPQTVAPPVNIIERDRDCHSIIFRYPKLVVPRSFSHVICHWIDSKTAAINHPVSFMCSMRTVNSPELKSRATSSGGTVRYNGKVMLFSGISQERLENKDRRANTRLNSDLRFIVGKKDRTELFPIGGPWNEADGGDPSADRSVLVRTAVRHLLEFTSVDLSHCKEWITFMELHYQREGFEEVTVIFVPKLWTIPALPQSEEPLVTEAKEEEPVDPSSSQAIASDGAAPQDGDVEMGDVEAKEQPDDEKEAVSGESALEAPAEEKSDTAEGEAAQLEGVAKAAAPPLAQIVTKETDTVTLIAAVPKDIKLKVMSLTLNGLLEYDESDKFEQTFEVSLFAELFQEMLQREFGDMVLESMVRFSKARQESMRPIDERPPPAKKVKVDEAQASGPAATGDDLVDGEAMDIDATVQGDANDIKDQADGETADGEPMDGEAVGGDAVDGKPADGKPADAEPVNGPADGEPVNGDPVDGEPDDGEPVDGEPVDGEPVDGEPVDGEPVDGEPVDGEPVDGEPVDGEPVDGEPVDGTPVDDVDSKAIDDDGARPTVAQEDSHGILAAAKDTIMGEPVRTKATAASLVPSEVDLLLLRAFEYFDSNDAGFLSPDRLERVLYSLGRHLSRQTVEDLVDKLMDVESGNVLFRKLIDSGQLSRNQR